MAADSQLSELNDDLNDDEDEELGRVGTTTTHNVVDKSPSDLLDSSWNEDGGDKVLIPAKTSSLEENKEHQPPVSVAKQTPKPLKLKTPKRNQSLPLVEEQHNKRDSSHQTNSSMSSSCSDVNGKYPDG